MTAALFAAFATYGWALIFSRLAGPWDVAKAIRERWPRGPFRCPACVGWWIGLVAAALYLAAERSQLARALAIVAGAPGAAAGVAWLMVYATEVLRRVSHALPKAREEREEREEGPRPPS